MIVPYISREDVSEALASLIYSRDLETNGLRYLLLVDLLVTAPEMPSGDGVRDFAIRELLEREIVRALSEQRAVLQLALPNQKAPLELVRHEIAEAVAQNTHQLIVWSLLYYRYVRAELGFSVEMLAKLLSIHLRTISRYSDEGIQLLTERLMLLERQVRQEQKQRRLIAALPYSVPIRLTGRMQQMRSVHEMLAAFSPRHIFITGASGIGKTMFVQEVLRQQIAEGNLEQLVWIDQPASVEYARQRITEVLLREDGTLDLREYLLLHSTAIVCDGIEALATEQSAFEQLLRDLGTATVILVNRIYLPLSSLEAHLALPELDFDAASEMLDDFMSGNDGTYNDAVIHSLYQRFGGNPLALRLGLGLWQSTENWSVVQEELGERLLGQLFLTLSDEGKVAWCLCALFPRGISSSDLASNSSISSRTLRALQQYGLLQEDSELYKLVPIARDFIWQEYVRNAEVKLMVDTLFAWIETQDRGFEVIEQALVTGFPEMSTIQRRRWIREGWKEGIRRNHWVIWRTIIEEYIHEDFEFRC